MNSDWISFVKLLYSRFGKRLLDLVILLGAAPICVLLSVTCAVIVALFDGLPVLFAQNRPGLRGRSFRLLKIRTMREAYDQNGVLLNDGLRITKIGGFLRSTSLDELPTLWNVLRGDMSLVGPRPLLMQYLDRYTPEQARRHEVRPGITGWAQVNGRNALSWEQKFERDVWYVDNMSLWLDLKILAMTLWKVVRREGISAGGHATMPEFMGTEGDG